MIYLRIKSWETFQHYKDRNPTWIKLHKSLLDNFEYQSLPLASRALAPMLWLLASEYPDISKGLIEYNFKKIAFRLHTTEREVEDAVKPLIANGFLEVCKDASGALAEPGQVDSPETYREEDIGKIEKTEKEVLFEAQKPPSKKFPQPPGCFNEFWETFPRQRRGSRTKAEAAYRKALTRAISQEIKHGLSAYLASSDVANGFAKGAEAWLNADGWSNSYKPHGSNQQGRSGSKLDRAKAALCQSAIDLGYAGAGREGETEPYQPDPAMLQRPEDVWEGTGAIGGPERDVPDGP